VDTAALQTSSDVQSESTKEIPQNPPTPENIPMRVDSQSKANILVHPLPPPPNISDFGMAWDIFDADDLCFFNPHYVAS
jgi:hypothetical protein